jgi:hypothetical protein
VAAPEILPHERTGGAGRAREPEGRPEEFWVRGQRIVITRPGPLAMVLGLLALGALVAVGAVLFLGFFLLLIPAIGVMVAGFILAALLRGPRRL